MTFTSTYNHKIVGSCGKSWEWINGLIKIARQVPDTLGKSSLLGGCLEAGLCRRKVYVLHRNPLYDLYDQFDPELSQMGHHKSWIIIRQVHDNRMTIIRLLYDYHDCI